VVGDPGTDGRRAAGSLSRVGQRTGELLPSARR
jgi:hypothetical protein